ncbi:MAG: glucosaminidase domain-containing protein [Candidatus Diapherotrites archaeon]|nr:glucosaminidase domain-containing protein [Candidatus Diapherotrites archaeon]
MKKIALAAVLLAFIALLSANAFAQSQSYVQTIVSGGCPLPELDKPMPVLSDRPCLSVEFINDVFEKYNSPAKGNGKWFVKYSHDYGIDNAVALAIFKYESTWGTNSRWVGRPGGACSKGTKGIGNIKYNSGMPDFRCGTWSAYNSWEDSIKGFFDYLKNSKYYVKAGKTTIDEILPIYAPASENDTDTYIKNVKSDVRSWRNMQRERVSNRIRLQRLLYAENSDAPDPGPAYASNSAFTRPDLSAVFSVLNDFLPKSVPLGRYGVRLFKNGAEVPYAYIDADGRTVLSSSAGRLSIEVKRGSSGGVTPSGLEVPESVVLEPGQSQAIVLPDKAELELSDGSLFELSEQLPAVIVKRPECVQNISAQECLPAESPIRREQGVNSTQLIAALSSIETGKGAGTYYTEDYFLEKSAREGFGNAYDALSEAGIISLGAPYTVSVSAKSDIEFSAGEYSKETTLRANYPALSGLDSGEILLVATQSSGETQESNGFTYASNESRPGFLPLDVKAGDGKVLFKIIGVVRDGGLVIFRGTPATITVERREMPSGAFEEIASFTVNGPKNWFDETVSNGKTYAYRAVAEYDGETFPSIEVSVMPADFRIIVSQAAVSKSLEKSAEDGSIEAGEPVRLQAVIGAKSEDFGFEWNVSATDRSGSRIVSEKLNGKALSYTFPAETAGGTFEIKAVASRQAPDSGRRVFEETIAWRGKIPGFPLSAKTIGEGNEIGVKLEWAKVDGAEKYDVFRNGKIASSIPKPNTSIIDAGETGAGLAPGTYSYQVKAVDAAGKTIASSGIASVTIAQAGTAA